jgi:hypothetical protein
MDPDEFKQAWQSQTSQTRLMVDAELLLEEVRHKELSFTRTIYWRDIREVGVSLLMVPVWIYLGVKQALPWTWYLMVPAFLWIAGYMLADRMRHKRQPPPVGESLRQRVPSLLDQIEHQIWLLRHVHWWYLMPLAVPAMAFFGQLSWRERSGGWLTALGTTVVAAVVVFVFGVIYRVNQYAIRAFLEPQRSELEAMLKNLQDEVSVAN